MALILAGIDEAGYGPTLGPLCVALSAFRIPDGEGGGVPCLWKLLSKGVCREPGRSGKADARGRVAIADSKALKLSNSVKSTHPLIHLERGVLAFLRLIHNEEPEELVHDFALFSALSASAHDPIKHHTCYHGAPRPIPVSLSQGDLSISSRLVRSAMENAGAALVSLRVMTIGENDYNSIIRETGNKGETTAWGFGSHLKFIWEHFAQESSGDRVGVVCDRLGGRAAYALLLEREVAGCIVEIIEECEHRSRYILRGKGPDGAARKMGVAFLTEGESAHLPIALASMAAKYVRELMMHRFNAYWNSFYREVNGRDIAATAGYALDARRWLEEIGDDVLGRMDREALVRIA